MKFFPAVAGAVVSQNEGNIAFVKSIGGAQHDAGIGVDAGKIKNGYFVFFKIFLGEAPLELGAPKAWVCQYDDDEFKYLWEEIEMDCDDLEFIGESCHENEIVCEADGYSYIEVEGGLNCCGLEGINDFDGTAGRQWFRSVPD